MAVGHLGSHGGSLKVAVSMYLSPLCQQAAHFRRTGVNFEVAAPDSQGQCKRDSESYVTFWARGRGGGQKRLECGVPVLSSISYNLSLDCFISMLLVMRCDALVLGYASVEL